MGAGIGDLNGDGFDDLAVGAWNQSNPEAAEGNTFIYYGAPGGVPTTPSLSLDNPDDAVAANFGFVFSGDLNGDGYSDLVVGAPGTYDREDYAGVSYVFYGGPEGIETNPSVTIPNPTGQLGGGFGVSHAVIDTDADGWPTLFLGAFQQDGESANDGVVYLFPTSAAGITSTPAGTLANPVGASGEFGILALRPR